MRGRGSVHDPHTPPFDARKPPWLVVHSPTRNIEVPEQVYTKTWCFSQKKFNRIEKNLSIELVLSNQTIDWAPAHVSGGGAGCMGIRVRCTAIKQACTAYVHQKDMGTDPPTTPHGTCNLQNPLKVGELRGAWKREKDPQAKPSLETSTSDTNWGSNMKNQKAHGERESTARRGTTTERSRVWDTPQTKAGKDKSGQGTG